MTLPATFWCGLSRSCFLHELINHLPACDTVVFKNSLASPPLPVPTGQPVCNPSWTTCRMVVGMHHVWWWRRQFFSQQVHCLRSSLVSLMLISADRDDFQHQFLRSIEIWHSTLISDFKFWKIFRESADKDFSKSKFQCSRSPTFSSHTCRNSQMSVLQKKAIYLFLIHFSHFPNH